MYAADKPFDQRKNTAGLESHQVETLSLYRQKNQRERDTQTDREAMDLTSEQIGSRHTTETEQRSASGA